MTLSSSRRCGESSLLCAIAALRANCSLALHLLPAPEVTRRCAHAYACPTPTAIINILMPWLVMWRPPDRAVSSDVQASMKSRPHPNVATAGDNPTRGTTRPAKLRVIPPPVASRQTGCHAAPRRFARRQEMGDTGLETVGGGAVGHGMACLLGFGALRLAGICSERNLERNLGGRAGPPCPAAASPREARPTRACGPMRGVPYGAC
jgi:hypothetical protein